MYTAMSVSISCYFDSWHREQMSIWWARKSNFMGVKNALVFMLGTSKANIFVIFLLVDFSRLMFFSSYYQMSSVDETSIKHLEVMK